MKLPRDLDGPDLIKALRILGYTPTRQKGSHIRVTTQQNGEHHEVVPNHCPIAAGTLRTILRSVAAHHKLTFVELMEKLDL
jgi:predicted RNA binding protein YcfA (HicA-like mRNA interferase family)